MKIEFERENRYIVVKRSDLDKLYKDPTKYATTFGHALALIAPHFPKRQFLVIESDWPEYEPAWKMIEARMTGTPASPKTAQQPFAWAFRWDYDHGNGWCRNALRFVQSMDEVEHEDKSSWREIQPLYTRADAGDGVNWKAVASEQKGIIEQQQNLIASLRAELSESYRVWSRPQGESVTIEAVAVTRENGEGCLRLEWLLEGGIAQMEVAGMVLFAIPEANDLCDEDGSAEIYLAPPQVEPPAPIAVVGVDPGSPGGDLCCELEGVVLPDGKLRIDKITHRESDGSYWQTHNPILKTWNDCTQEEARQLKRRGFFVRRIDLEAQP